MEDKFEIVYELELPEDKPQEFWANVFPKGEFYHWWYGKITVDDDLLKEIKRNFDLGYPHYGVPINVHHDPKMGLYGQIVDLEIRESGLWALIKLNNYGYQKVYDEGYKYYSVELDYDYQDPETNDTIGATLVGLALTYLPAHPLVAAETNNGFIQMFSNAVEKFFNLLKGAKKFMIPRVINTPASDNPEWNWSWSRDADTIINNLGWIGLAKACAYVDMENYDIDPEDKLPHNKAAYKLPHHKYINGKLTLVWGGVRAAMQRFPTTDLPEKDRKKVYNHLAAHYRYFEKTPPEFNEVIREVDEMGEKNVDFEAKVKEYEAKIQDYEAKVKEYETKLKEFEAKVKELEAQAKKVEDEKLELWAEQWRSKGIAPVIVDRMFEKVKEGKLSVEEAEEIFKTMPEYTKQEFEDGAKKTAVEKALEIVKEYNEKKSSK